MIEKVFEILTRPITHNVEENKIVVGNPAKIIKRINESSNTK